MKAVVRERKIPFEIKTDSVELSIQRDLEAFEALRQAAADNNIQDMSLEEINAEIKAVRDEQREKNLCSHCNS